MGHYHDLAEEFFTRYETPEVDDLIVGFSGIDPPLKVNASALDHERLQGLLGGNTDGHYHITRTLWEQIMMLLDERFYDGGFASTTESEYLLNEGRWMDGGTPDSD